MIDKLRELYDDWIKDERKNVGDPLYAYEVYEFLDYANAGRKARKNENI